MPENLKDGGSPLSINIPPELEFIRPDLLRFFDAMVYKLRRNVHKGRWENVDLDFALKELFIEYNELASELDRGSTSEILMEAADVANWALIIANIGLEAKNV